MDDGLITLWNNVVGPKDSVYHLGDFGLGPKDRLKEICQSLNGFKYLIRGNHDGSKSKMLDIGFNEVHKNQYLCLSDNEEGANLFSDTPLIYLTHKPKKPKDPNVNLVVCGHVHSLWKCMIHENVKYINVGVDVQGLVPISVVDLFRQAIGVGNAIY
jgi:calcineurin-like phosphoesterase family protein